MNNKWKIRMIVTISVIIYNFINPVKVRSQNVTNENAARDISQPLYLTPYIQNGDFDQAKTLSLVEFVDEVNLSSYSGFFTVNVVYDVHLFFWFFPHSVSLIFFYYKK